MLIRRNPLGESPEREITELRLYRRRREFIRDLGVAAGWMLMPGCSRAEDVAAKAGEPAGKKSPVRSPDGFTTDEAHTPFEDASSYNNFYEFGTDKDDPAANAGVARHAPLVGLDRRARSRSRARVALEDLLAATPRSRSASTGCAASRPGRW